MARVLLFFVVKYMMRIPSCWELSLDFHVSIRVSVMCRVRFRIKDGYC